MEVRPPDYGEVAYLGARAASGAQSLVLVALLIATFALVLWQGNAKPAGSTPQLQTTDSVGAKS